MFLWRTKEALKVMAAADDGFLTPALLSAASERCEGCRPMVASLARVGAKRDVDGSMESPSGSNPGRVLTPTRG